MALGSALSRNTVKLALLLLTFYTWVLPLYVEHRFSTNIGVELTYASLLPASVPVSP